MKKVTYFQYSVTEFEEIIKNEYKIEYSIPDRESTGYGVCLTYVMKPDNVITDNDKKHLKRFLKGEKVGFMLDIFFADLCERKILPYGNYLIEIGDAP